MSFKNFVSYFAIGFIGGVIYEVLLYLYEPFDPDWLNLGAKIFVISICVALTINLGKHFAKAQRGD